MKREKISILEDIGKILTDSTNPEVTFNNLIELIAKKWKIDVCSVYRFDSKLKILTLIATTGLSKDQINKIQMSVDEGLTGLVMEKMEPVFVVEPSKHKRFKYFEKSGEEKYQTFLGVPLVYMNKILGVMVIQTIKKDALSKSDISLLSSLAIQISGTIAYSGLLEKLSKEREAKSSKGIITNFSNNRIKVKDKKNILRGTSVSQGFAEGYAHYLSERIGFEHVVFEKVDDQEAEKNKLQKAFQLTRNEIEKLAKHVKNLSGEDEAILDAHLMYIKDNSLKSKIFSKIEEGYSATSALKKIVFDYVDFFSTMDDPYLKERGSDIEDIGKRILRNIVGLSNDNRREFTKDTVIIANDISPLDIMWLKQEKLKAIVLLRGGRTSHAVILAKSFNIPMLINVKDVLDSVHEGDFLIVDGASGVVYKEPPQIIIEEYERLKKEKAIQLAQQETLREYPTITLDGFRLKNSANIGMLSDIEMAKKYGADHIGLYRTEFLFLSKKDFPSEDSQFDLYKKILEEAKGKSVTIRTLDAGGDKFLSYLDYPKEENPFLGWRSIRFSLDMDDVFRTQLRAILRASIYGKTKILFPMISSVDEVRKILTIINEEKQVLKENNKPYDESIELGIMVEVPGIVIILDRILPDIQFVSIGTNDLIQFLLAVDRNNSKVASIYNPMHPSVIKTIYDVVSICKASNKSVSICGETASNPRCAYLFLGMQTDELSMNSRSIPLIKELVRKVNLSDAEKAVEKVLKMESADEITAYVDSILPDISFS